MLTDHLTVAIEDIDVQVANWNAQIDEMRTQVDVLVDARVELVKILGTLDPGAPGPADVEKAEPMLPAHVWDNVPKKPKLKPRPTKTTTGSSSKYDLAEIAAVAVEAIEGGRHPIDALMSATQCPTPQMARYLMTSARAAGHDIPSTRGMRLAKTASLALALTALEADPPPERYAPRASTTVPYIRRHADDVAELERRALG